MSKHVFGLKARLRESNVSYAEAGEDEFVDADIESKRAPPKKKAKAKVSKPMTKEDRKRAKVKRLDAEDDYTPAAAKKKEKLKEQERKEKAFQLAVRKRVAAHTDEIEDDTDDGVRLSPTDLFALPAELILMIFENLELLDVVNIKRAVEPYNQTAASPIEITDACWHAVYVKAGLPALQENDDMVEREIIEFLTDETCEVCNVSKTDVEYICELRLRVCRKCSEEEDTFITDEGTTLHDIVPALHPFAVECIPSSSSPRYGKRGWSASYYAPDLLHVSAELHALQKKDDKKKGKPAAKKKAAESSKPPAGKKKGKMAAAPAPKPGPLVKAYLEDGRGLAKAYRETASALDTAHWEMFRRNRAAAEAKKLAKETADRKIREENWAFVMAKGAELEFTSVEMSWSSMVSDALIYAPVPFTEDDWEIHGQRFIAAFAASSTKLNRGKGVRRTSYDTYLQKQWESAKHDGLVSAYKILALTGTASEEGAPGFIPFVDWASLPTIRALVTDPSRVAVSLSALQQRSKEIEADIEMWRVKARFLNNAWRLHVVHDAVVPAEWRPTHYRARWNRGAPIAPTNAFVLPDDHETMFPADVYDEATFFKHPIFSPDTSKLFNDVTALTASVDGWCRNTVAWLPAAALSQKRVAFTRKLLEAAGVDVNGEGQEARAELDAIGRKFLVYKEEKQRWDAGPHWEVKVPLTTWEGAIDSVLTSSYWEEWKVMLVSKPPAKSTSGKGKGKGKGKASSSGGVKQQGGK